MALPEGQLNLQQVVRELEKRVSELEAKSEPKAPEPVEEPKVE